MSELRFEWDGRKNVQNQRNHGISFEEAQTAFLDDHAMLIDDPDHSSVEERFILLGVSATLRHLVVCHCYRESQQRHPHHFGSKGNGNRTRNIPPKVGTMRKEYDFSKARRNPYAKRLKRQVTIRLDDTTIAYFKALSDETGIRYQTLINLYLRDCATSRKRLSVAWRPEKDKGAA